MRSTFKVTSPVELGTVEFAAEVQEDVNFGCNAAPARYPNQIGVSSTEHIPTKSNETVDGRNKKGVVINLIIVNMLASFIKNKAKEKCTGIHVTIFTWFQISVATFHLGRLELAQQSIGSRSCIKVQGASLSGEECPSISWEEFQVTVKELKLLRYCTFICT